MVYLLLQNTLTLVDGLNLYNDRYHWTARFDISLCDLDSDSRSQECEKTKTSTAIVSKSFESIWMELGLLSGTSWCDEPHTHFISSIQ